MKLLFAFLIIIFTLGIKNDTPPYRLEYVYQVEIYTGLTLYGNNALVYNQEGLIIRRETIDSSGEWVTYRHFIDFDSIHDDKLISLNSFVNRHSGLKDLSENYEDDGNWFHYPRYYVVRGGKNNYFKLITDKNYGSRTIPVSDDEVLLDSLTMLMNALIPEEYDDFRME